MGIFRLFQPHTDEYMFVWNSLVALHTFPQLSDDKQEELMEHYLRIVAINVSQPAYDTAAFTPIDPFWLSFTLADMGIPPMLGPRGAKWFYITNPRRARYLATSRAQELGEEILRDIHNRYGIRLSLPK